MGEWEHWDKTRYWWLCQDGKMPEYEASQANNIIGRLLLTLTSPPEPSRRLDGFREPCSAHGFTAMYCPLVPLRWRMRLQGKSISPTTSPERMTEMSRRKYFLRPCYGVKEIEVVDERVNIYGNYPSPCACFFCLAFSIAPIKIRVF